jgi:hypothetical protein
MPGLSEVANCFKCLVTGQQAVAKGRQQQEAANDVVVLVAVIRIPHVQSDVLISFNAPRYISQHSLSAQQTGSGWQAGASQARALFLDILKTFQVLDWGLFGH